MRVGVESQNNAGCGLSCGIARSPAIAIAGRNYAGIEEAREALSTLLGIGTVVMTLLGRRDDIITTAITTAVVMAVAAMSPQDAWHQPLLRLVDTVVGIAVGVTCK
jgi:hypothetical protein